MRIADVLRHKGSGVATIDSSESVATLLAGLAQHNIGAMVVTADGAVVGIVSERDVVRQLADRSLELLQVPVGDIMTSMVVTCGPDDTVDALMRLVTDRRVRHIPVLVNGELAGIVSIGDLVNARMDQLEGERRQLESYISQG